MRHIGMHTLLLVFVTATAACSTVTDVRIGGDEQATSVARDAQVAQNPRALQADTAPALVPRVPEDSGTLVLVCDAPQADCDGDAANGCEADLTRDPQHCGSCTTACPSADCACEDGELVTRCPPGHADCDDDARNGCETDIWTDMLHCGACEQRCHADGFAAASAACELGECQVTCQRPTLRADCDENPDTGCEAELWEDPENCGACGRVCQICNDGRCL